MNGLIGKFRGFYLIEKAKDLVKGEKGQTLVEYALILVLIAIVAMVAMRLLGGTVNSTYNTVNSHLVSGQ